MGEGHWFNSRERLPSPWIAPCLRVCNPLGTIRCIFSPNIKDAPFSACVRWTWCGTMAGIGVDSYRKTFYRSSQFIHILLLSHPSIHTQCLPSHSLLWTAGQENGGFIDVRKIESGVRQLEPESQVHLKVCEEMPFHKSLLKESSRQWS